MSSYLRRLAQIFAQEVGSELYKYTFVFPNHRAGLFFRKYIGESLSCPTFSPEIMTINECFASLSELRIVDQLSLIVRLYNIYSSLHPKPEPLEQFLHWGKMMLSDFSEVDNHLITNVKALYTTVEDMHDLDTKYGYLSDTQREAIRRFWGEFHVSAAHNFERMHVNFLRTWQLLYPMYEQLTTNLLKEGLAYEGLLHRQVISEWDAIPQAKFRAHYVFVGFNALTASEKQLLIKLRDKGLGDFYFDYENDCLSDSTNRASLFKEFNQKNFTSKYLLPSGENSISPTITHISVTSSIGEAQEVHHILQELYPGKNSDEEYTRTAVVLPDEQLLIPLLNCIPESVKKINVTMGYPLRATSLYMAVAYPEQVLVPMSETAAAFVDEMRSYLLAQRNEDNSEAIYQLTKVLDRLETSITTFPQISFSVADMQQLLKMQTSCWRRLHKPLPVSP